MAYDTNMRDLTSVERHIAQAFPGNSSGYPVGSLDKSGVRDPTMLACIERVGKMPL